MLMIGGFERYCQIARCFRDEDLRADRQPDFTQLDIEVSFVDQEDIISLNEELISFILERTHGKAPPTPFPRLSYADALNTYVIDKSDIRFVLELKDATALYRKCGLQAYSKAIKAGTVTKGLPVPA